MRNKNEHCAGYFHLPLDYIGRKSLANFVIGAPVQIVAPIVQGSFSADRWLIVCAMRVGSASKVSITASRETRNSGEGLQLADEERQ